MVCFLEDYRLGRSGGGLGRVWGGVGEGLGKFDRHPGRGYIILLPSVLWQIGG